MPSPALLPLALLSMLACNSGPSRLGFPSDAECETAATPLSEASWSGTSEAELLTSLATFAPTVVRWDAATLGPASSALSLVPTRTAAVAQVVERSRGGSATDESDAACRPGPELLLAMTFAVDIDGGAVTGEVPGTLASPVDGSTVYFDALGPVALDATWEDLANTAFDERNPGASAFDWRFTVSFQKWESGAAAAIEGVGDGSAPDVGESTSALWSGHLAGSP